MKILISFLILLCLVGCINTENGPELSSGEATESPVSQTEPTTILSFDFSYIQVAGPYDFDQDLTPIIIRSANDLENAYQHFKETYNLQSNADWTTMVQKYKDGFFDSKTLILFPTELIDVACLNEYEVINVRQESGNSISIELINNWKYSWFLDAYAQLFFFVEVDGLLAEDCICKVEYSR